MKKANSRLANVGATEVPVAGTNSGEKIDTSDIPEITDWSMARRGTLYRPVKRQITLRLDADVIAWFRSRAPEGRGYQTEINRVLRDYAMSASNE